MKRKIILGIEADRFGNVIGNKSDKTREFVLLDIDTLVWRRVRECDLHSISKEYEVNFKVDDNGNIFFLSPCTYEQILPKLCGNHYVDDSGEPLTLLGVLYSNRNNRVEKYGYRVYNIRTQECDDISAIDVERLEESFMNAQWLSSNLEGCFYKEEYYPIIEK